MSVFGHTAAVSRLEVHLEKSVLHFGRTLGSLEMSGLSRKRALIHGQIVRTSNLDRYYV